MNFFWRAVFATTLLLSSQAEANEGKPAVSEPNGLAAVTFGAAGGSGDNAAAFLVGGQYTVPMGDSFGARLDLNGGVAFGTGTSGAEAAAGSFAAFWRDPDSGYVQFQGLGSHFGSVDIYGGGISGAQFRDDWDFDLGVNFVETPDGSAITSGLGVGRYPNEDLRWHLGLNGGASFSGEASYGGEFGVAWQPSMLTRNFVFEVAAGGGSVGNVGYYQVALSAALYFGDAKSLRQKIREDW